MAFDLFPGSSYNNMPGLGTFSNTAGEIDLRKEIHDILYGNGAEPQRGHWVVFRRYDTSRYSDNYNPESGEGKGGPMYPYEDEVWMTRRLQYRASTFGEQEVMPGLLPVPFMVFYFEHNLNPKLEDEIYELNWDDHTQKPVNPQEPFAERFNIKLVQPYRDINGRIEYWAVVAVGDKTSW